MNVVLWVSLYVAFRLPLLSTAAVFTSVFLPPAGVAQIDTVRLSYVVPRWAVTVAVAP